jgi:hypothetical protein
MLQQVLRPSLIVAGREVLLEVGLSFLSLFFHISGDADKHTGSNAARGNGDIVITIAR